MNEYVYSPVKVNAIMWTGDHVLVGSYDRKLSWFDLDLSNKPYQTLKYVCSQHVSILWKK